MRPKRRPVNARTVLCPEELRLNTRICVAIRTDGMYHFLASSLLMSKRILQNRRYPFESCVFGQCGKLAALPR